MNKRLPFICTSFCFWSSLGIPSTKQTRVTCEAEPRIVNLNAEVDMAACSSSCMYLSTPSSTRIPFTFHLRLTLGNEGSVEQLKTSSPPSVISSGPSISSLVGLSKHQFLFLVLLRLSLHSIITLVNASSTFDPWLTQLMFRDLYIFKAETTIAVRFT